MPDPAVAGPPFWRYAAKAFVALGVGVVVSGGVIIAAAADDRITTSEWVQIIVAVLGALFGAGGVYQVENATKAGSVVEAQGELVDGQAPPVDGSAAAQRAYPSSPWDVPK
jgi:enoyl-CoA hydratase/carnithine racemase